MKEQILNTIDDLCMNFFVYDRKNDEDLSFDDIQKAFDNKEITIDEMVERFRQSCEDTLMNKDEIGKVHIKRIPHNCCVVIENQEQWDKVRNYVDGGGFKYMMQKIYLKHILFTWGMSFTYSVNKFNSTKGVIKHDFEELKEISFDQLIFD